MGRKKAIRLQKGYRKLRLGMHKQEVLSLLGEPDMITTRGEVKIFTWVNREFKGILRGGHIERKVFVEMEQGAVVGYNGVYVDASTW